MEGIRRRSAFARLAAGALTSEPFRLVDVGCSGGIDEGWREFGERLEVIAIDGAEDEIDRLVRAESNPAIRYLHGWVGIPDQHPAKYRKAVPTPLHRWPGGRLSYQRSVHIREAKARSEPPLSLADYYASAVHSGASEPRDGYDTDYARLDPYNGPDENGLLRLPTFLAAQGFSDLDFLKIDIDGPDFEILRDMQESLERPQLLGVGIEVNFVGSHDANDHTFHNVDRLMRSRGFDLFNLTVRRYSSAALPWPYQDALPALTTGGRPVQGDAVYLRDLSSPVHRQTALQVSDDKLLKLAAVFALLHLPDEAAEMLLIHRQRLGAMLDIDQALDLLALEIQETDQTSLSYQDYIAAFEAEAPQIMNQNGRRAIWMEGLIAGQTALAEARSRIADLEGQLELERSRSSAPASQKPRRGLFRL